MNIHELDKLLKSKKIHPQAVSIGQGLPSANEQYCIVQEDFSWEVYYAEKGQKSDLKKFDKEEDACNYLLLILRQDNSVWLI